MFERLILTYNTCRAALKQQIRGFIELEVSSCDQSSIRIQYTFVCVRTPCFYVTSMRAKG